MALYYCVENEYKNTPWCTETVAGLHAEIKRKKLGISEIENINALETSTSEKSSVIIIGSLKNWISDRIAETCAKGMLPIVLSNTSIEYTSKAYSNVSSDVYGALRTAISTARENGKGRIALYGINLNSASDYLRKKAFLKFGCNRKDIYNNHGSLKGCFYSFFPSIECYDTIICANDFVAASLVTRLKRQNYDLSRLYIISCSDGILLEHMSPSVTAFSRNFKAFGKAAISAHDMFTKNPDIAFSDIQIKHNLTIRETTKGLVKCSDVEGGVVLDEEGSFSIYEDPELLEIMKVERILRGGDSTDIKILEQLSQKLTYESIAERLFISLSAVKYRLKNLCKLAEVSGIKELLALVEKYYLP